MYLWTYKKYIKKFSTCIWHVILTIRVVIEIDRENGRRIDKFETISKRPKVQNEMSQKSTMTSLIDHRAKKALYATWNLSYTISLMKFYPLHQLSFILYLLLVKRTLDGKIKFRGTIIIQWLVKGRFKIEVFKKTSIIDI